jgi:hypothetical protein
MATKLISKPAKLQVTTVEEQAPETALPSSAFSTTEALQTPDALALDAAAALLLAMLEERDTFLIQQTCEQQQLRPWMYVVGIVRRALDTGDHTLPAVDPLWRTWGAWTQKVIPDVVCPICSKQFTPRWQGQRYDTNECGAAASRAALAVANTSRSALPGVGDESPEQCKSTIGRDESGVPTMGEALADAQKALDDAVGKQASPGGLVKTATMEGTLQ